LAFTAILSASTPALALSTIGDMTCPKWTSNRADPTTAVQSRSWLLGFMTGLAITSQTDVLQYTDAESVGLWMDNYCRAHPLDTVATSGLALFTELRERIPK
jgi:hypothetical protein